MKITDKVIARDWPRRKTLRRVLAGMERELRERERRFEKLHALVQVLDDVTAIIDGVAVREHHERYNDGRYGYAVRGALNNRSAHVYESAKTDGDFGLTVYVVGEAEQWYGCSWKRREAVAAARAWVVKGRKPRGEK